MSLPSSLLSMIPVGPKAPLAVPAEFTRLNDLAYNLWWSWRPEAAELFRSIDPVAWDQSGNPMSILHTIASSTWARLAEDEAYVTNYTEVTAAFDRYLQGGDTWYATAHGDALAGPVAYLCTEFGLHHKLRLYSGGLGVLAGDHVKAASDLGIPLIGVGLLYRRGYFHQAVDPLGAQQHTYAALQLARRPLREVMDPNSGRPIRVRVPLGDRTICAGAWRIDVGRVPVLFLDTDVEENQPSDRPITHFLYVRGREMRLAQEIVLGIGGTRLLAALGIEPAVWHVNEGHAALSLLERLSRAMGEGVDLEQARKQVSSSTLFTLHTPIPAGNEVFDRSLALPMLSGTLPGVDDELLTSLSDSHDGGRFDMGALAIRLAAITNGVSQRHGEVVTHEWSQLIGGDAKVITNGIHPQTWVGRSMSRIYERVVGDLWDQRIVNGSGWEQVRQVPAAELWQAHQSQKAVMLRRIRARMREQYSRHGYGPSRLQWLEEQLPEDRLTIVFARRFATYKRAGLFFSDPARVRHLLSHPEMPVQIIFAGKAHPADAEGQALVRWVFEMSQSPDMAGHVFFVENYDMEVGASLVRGADVWLNTPTPPKEASGTSGMKAAANGAVNLSVLDGWWAEGFNGSNGWGFSETSNSDAEDAGILYHLLEAEVIPMFYDRDDKGVPQRWVEMMKESIV
ncbi:MAG: alpha-glucan family phosphorylase, partial [Acidimicrobiia bacterium]|nr:alpha-glucan family phosphorylase [Acidimicrobiia bacterium]